MDIWSWICELPNSAEFNSPLTFDIARSNPSSAQSIQLRAEPTLDSNSNILINFSICFLGFTQYHPTDSEKENSVVAWASDTCPLSSEKPFLPLVLHLLREIVSRYPNSQLQELKPEPISWILDSHSPESFSTFFSLILLTRLFWLCVFDSPSELGSFYFHRVISPEALSPRGPGPIMRNFFVAVGTDVELCFVRTFGYMLAKLLILRDVEAGSRDLTLLPPRSLGFSYAVESHGMWALKGYTPVKSMQCMQYCRKSRFSGIVGPKESLLKYALAHQQLEAVIQFEYTVLVLDSYIQVKARVDNIRVHVVKLGFKSGSGEDFLSNEKHFPSRVRACVGPEVGASYVGGLSLGRPTARAKIKNWKWDQDVEGNLATFDAILCDNKTGVEIATWKPPIGGEETGEINFRRRYAGGGTAFTKSGGLILAGEEYGEGVGWRLSKEMEGSVLKWRIGGQVWLSYWSNDVDTRYYETRFVDWCDEVDLPLIPSTRN